MEGTLISQTQAYKYQKYVVEFYNRLACRQVKTFEEIPTEALEFLMQIPYGDLIRPFVLEDKQKGYGRPALSEKYRVGEGVVRGMGR